MSKRFRPAQRLHSPPEYAAVFAARRVLRGACFDLLCGVTKAVATNAVDVVLPQALPQARLGLVIPKRLARRAVLRNTIKRQAREVFRHHSETLPAADIVLRLARWPQAVAALVVTPDALKHLLREEIESLLDKLRRRNATTVEPA